MRRRRATLAIVALALAGLVPARSRAQARFPQRPIQLVVPFGPGGIADITARTVADDLSRRLGQPVVVDNRPSAGGIVGSQAVASARPDGHTLLLMSNANAVSVGLFRKLPVDPRGFAPISTLGAFDLGLFVAADSAHRTLAQLLAAGRARPGTLNIGTIAVGSTQHLAARLFQTSAGLDALLVPYPASPAVLTALRSGEIDVAVEIVGPMLPQVKAGVVRALAVSGRTRHPSLPAVPTVIEAGVADYEVGSWNALAAPAGTPAAVVETLNRALRETLATPQVQQSLGAIGMRVAPSTPAELERLLATEIRRWGEVMRAAGIQPQ